MVYLWVHHDQILTKRQVNFEDHYKYLYLLKQCKYDERGGHTTNKYNNLIDGFNYNNYNDCPDEQKVIVKEMPDYLKNEFHGKNWMIHNGEHRAALLLFYNISPFKVIVQPWTLQDTESFENQRRLLMLETNNKK